MPQYAVDKSFAFVVSRKQKWLPSDVVESKLPTDTTRKKLKGSEIARFLCLPADDIIAAQLDESGVALRVANEIAQQRLSSFAPPHCIRLVRLLSSPVVELQKFRVFSPRLPQIPPSSALSLSPALISGRR